MLFISKINKCTRSHISGTLILLSLFYILFNLLLLEINHIEAIDQPSLVDSSDKLTTAPTVSNATKLTEIPTSDDDDTKNNTTRDVTLLSSEEFPDAKNVPTILFDSLDESDNKNATLISNTTATNQSSQTITNITHDTTTTTGRTSLKVNEKTASILTTNNETVPLVNSNEDLNDETGGINEENSDELEEEPNSTTSPFNTTTTTTTSSSSTSTSDSTKETSSMSSFEPPQNISQYMDYIEKLFHDLRHQIADLFQPHIPQLIRTSQMVELSGSCSYDMLRMALALRQFEPWALRMIDSSGKVPEGIFEGSFTALGSYDECLNTVFQSQGSSHSMSATVPTSSASSPSSGVAADDGAEERDSLKTQVQPTQGKYCLVNLSPFMPPKPPADKVERMFQEEANRRNYTRDDQFSRLSPMFYYMKFRIGVCLPSSCDQNDMDSISNALSSSLRLNITIPDCRVKHTNPQPLTSAQLVGGLIFASIVTLVLSATLADLFKIKFKRIQSQEMRLCDQVQVVASNQQADGRLTLAAGKLEKSSDIRIKIRLPQATRQSAHSKSQFTEQLDKHWTWMSFSLLTNFRLYFQNGGDKLAARQLSNALDGEKKRNTKVEFESPIVSSTTISCLNGIRVISLCWVIIANSYLTLDPRATKRLAKTREAPRDFLFQLVVQASLAIETFFFLSGLLMSLSFFKRLKQSSSSSSLTTSDNENDKNKITNQGKPQVSMALRWLHFYVHRYIRMTPPTMLVIAFSMYAYHLGDGPLWFEATQRVHQSCAQNWWRHLLHVANFIDTRQMCFIHYWYIAADMQLFLFAPLLMLALYKCRNLGYALVALVASASIGAVFYMTYERSLPPTLLFYNTDPESRREFGNTIMTKPFTHVLPYLVGMLVGWWCLVNQQPTSGGTASSSKERHASIESDGGSRISLTGLGGLLALFVALAEVFLPYQWNNSRLPSKLMASLYAALFRLGWSLVLAYIVMSCRHRRGRRCTPQGGVSIVCCSNCKSKIHHTQEADPARLTAAAAAAAAENHSTTTTTNQYCFCSTGGNYINRLLSLQIFAHLSKLSFVAYLIHLPLMSVFIGQTRGLFAFSHTLVIHFAISYLVMTFVLSFLLVHIIEFPFLTFERYLFDRMFQFSASKKVSGGQIQRSTYLSDKYISSSSSSNDNNNSRQSSKF